MLKNYYSFLGKGSLPSQKGVRSVQTLAKVAVTTCLECAKYGVLILSGTVAVGYMGPKMTLGMDHRPWLANFVGYHVTGLTASSEVVYTSGLTLVNHPDRVYLRQVIVETDGHTINPCKLFMEYTELPLSPEARAVMEVYAS